VSTVFFNWDASGTMGICNFDLGEVGIQASEANSGLKLAIDVGETGTGSYCGLFSGYSTGGG
jgi:hypothetical protein